MRKTRISKLKKLLNFKIKIKPMKKLILILIIIPLITLNTTSCINDDDVSKDPIDQLPLGTQTGENTFGCLINGKPLSVSNSREITAIYQGGVLQLGGGEENSNEDIDITINLEAPLDIDTSYDLTSYPNYISKFRKILNNVNCSYEYLDTYEGSIKLSKFDRVNYIVSGTFEFSTVTDNCETINITDGRFDMKYIP
ncbi:hypothetical protein FPF71_03080 [Algibacter amylolyticus]|uniref:Uncharacterized protein n=1 Tax=Algibacter amylolyticus TaxID=1608400 RepID=A0A5M7BHQ5_9FLAO|nr:DUF6252 family protein [Algibacter amylolyticus]KAA5827837.1 hypothetical protein F2B50_03080 [Algibacter amylolyticus]MBB5267066.1 hypothetical protein [Algibacter amylolyticus]TSJ82082.1 hypothetical protein FPF71_03080 [Algibacter amylolyticus]